MKLYLKYVSIQLKCQMQYKKSFFMTILGQFLGAFSMFLSIYFMFDRFNSVKGYTYSQVLICFATVLMSFSIAECFARGFDLFSNMIRNSEFDRVMVRPRNEILQVLAMKIELTRLGRFIQAVLVLIYAIPRCGVEWTGDRIVLLIMMIISGSVVFTALFIFSAGICFFTTESLEFMNIFTDGGREFGRYPFSIYGKNVLKFFTYVVPLALFQYYPFLYLIGRTDNKFYMFTPIIAMLFIIPCLLLWKIGIRHYKSNGS